jgi:hypothetical protein
MTTNEVPQFSLCEECLKSYQGLRFNEKALLRENIIPLATIFWDDEHPQGLPQPICNSKKCFESISLLIAARSEYWEHAKISPKYSQVWQAAKTLIPEWAGFRRLSLSKEERLKIENCLQNALDWFSALHEASNGKMEFQESESGIIEYSATIDLTDEDEKGNLQA